MTHADQSQALDLDTKLLAEFIYALNIARRQVLSYPAGHPMVASATAKLVAVVPRLLEFRKEINLGVTRDALLVDESLMDAGNPVFQDLARNLFDVHIASLTIRRGLTEDEARGFFAIFQKSHEELADEGGIEQVIAAAGFKSLSAKQVDFSVFTTTEAAVVSAPEVEISQGGASLLWKTFVRGLVSGSLDPDGVKYDQRLEMDPDKLAEILNMEYSKKGPSVEKSYEEAITIFLNQGEQAKLRDADYRHTVGRLDEMVRCLKPDLRRKLLGSTLKKCAQRPHTAETFLKNIPEPTLVDAFENIDAGEVDLPQTLLDVFGKLSANRGDEGSQSRVVGIASRSVKETTEQLAELFREDRSQYFVPPDYQDALAAMSVANLDHTLDRESFEEVFLSMSGPAVDGQFSAVLIDMLGRGVDQSTQDAIDQNLGEVIDYCLNSGDFDSLSRIYGLLGSRDSSQPDDVSPEGRIVARFASDAFVKGILDGLDLWGNSVQQSILDLIEDVGPPFAEELLERLGEESSMSRRRLYMACLVRIGPRIQEIVADRLKDSRWYFVRNIVVVLREFNDPAVIPLLGHVSDYKHPKVQFEVLKTLLHYEDDRANQFLVKALSSRSSEKLMRPVRLAAQSRDPRVSNRLAQLLSQRLSGDQAMEVKNSVIKALEESATEAVLPELAKFFFGRKVFAASRNESLKVPALAILKKIGTLDAGIMAGQLAQTSSGELAKAAEEVLADIHRKLT